MCPLLLVRRMHVFTSSSILLITRFFFALSFLLDLHFVLRAFFFFFLLFYSFHSQSARSHARHFRFIATDSSSKLLLKPKCEKYTCKMVCDCTFWYSGDGTKYLVWRISERKSLLQSRQSLVVNDASCRIEEEKKQI